MGLLYHLKKAHVKHETGFVVVIVDGFAPGRATADGLSAFAASRSDELFVSTRHEIDTRALLWYCSPTKEIRTMKEMYILDVERRTTESRSGHI